ncbi:MAG: class I SAM-dependent methyltransferase [Bacteroidetes bacterium QS_1_63_11]|nr:MAG: class I SAM-dependent methyltransferase [Bacteroidetes bacterium QS_1_63_11]
MSWYEDWFWSDAYTQVYHHRDEAEAERLVDLIQREINPSPTAHILDVGCGRGRHARVLARRGHRVTGVDLSDAAIAEARSAAADEGLDDITSFQVGDMRDSVCEDCADGVVNLFTSFGYFQDDAENEQALRAMTTALRPGGWFLQDFLNAPVVADSMGPSTHETENGRTIHQDRWIEDGRVNKEIIIEHADGAETFHESVRLYTLYDLKEMYAAVGLELMTSFGSYDGDDYAPDESPRLLLHAVNAR